MLLMLLGLFFLLVGFLGIRWFYRVIRASEDRAEKIVNSAFEPMVAIFMVFLGIVGLFLIF